MKKTVVFEFPDGFEFPPEFFYEVCCDEKRMYGPSFICPFFGYDDYDDPYCVLTCGGKGDWKACPFYNGADTVNYDELR